MTQPLSLFTKSLYDKPSCSAICVAFGLQSLALHSGSVVSRLHALCKGQSWRPAAVVPSITKVSTVSFLGKVIRPTVSASRGVSYLLYCRGCQMRLAVHQPLINQHTHTHHTSALTHAHTQHGRTFFFMRKKKLPLPHSTFLPTRRSERIDSITFSDSYTAQSPQLQFHFDSTLRLLSSCDLSLDP